MQCATWGTSAAESKRCLVTGETFRPSCAWWVLSGCRCCRGSGSQELGGSHACLPACAQVPCASALCVVNIGTTEAKVELLSAEFVSLRREASAGGLGDSEGGADHFMFDDDDNYQLPVRKPFQSPLPIALSDRAWLRQSLVGLQRAPSMHDR